MLESLPFVERYAWCKVYIGIRNFMPDAVRVAAPSGKPTCASGDMDVFGRVYVGFNGSGNVFGEPIPSTKQHEALP